MTYLSGCPAKPRELWRWQGSLVSQTITPIALRNSHFARVVRRASSGESSCECTLLLTKSSAPGSQRRSYSITQRLTICPYYKCHELQTLGFHLSTLANRN